MAIYTEAQIDALNDFTKASRAINEADRYDERNEWWMNTAKTLTSMGLFDEGCEIFRYIIQPN